MEKTERQEKRNIIGKEQLTQKLKYTYLCSKRERWGWRNTERREKRNIVGKEQLTQKLKYTNVCSKRERDGDGGRQ